MSMPSSSNVVNRSCCQQYGALVKKNLIIKRREWKATIMEVAIPMIIVAMVALIRTAISRDERPDELNLERMFAFESQAHRWASHIEELDQVVAFAPDNAITRGLASTFEQSHDVFGTRTWNTFFASEAALTDYIKSTDYPDGRGNVAFGVVISQWDVANAQFDYSLRMNVSDDEGGTPRLQPKTTDFLITVRMTEMNVYRNQGFLDWQHHIDQTIMNLTLSSGNASLATSMLNSTNFQFAPMPTHAHVDDIFAGVLSGLIGFLYCLAFIWPVTKIVKLLVEEKETRIKEGMKMMGLSETALFCSHLTTYLIIFGITALLCMLVTAPGVYKNSDKGYVWTFFYFYGVCIFFFCFMVSSFFSKARTASTFSALIYLGFFFVSFALSDDSSAGAKSFFSLFFPVAMGMGAVTFANIEGAGGVDSGSANTNYLDYSVSQSLGMMVLDCFIYLLLGLYFNQIVPTDTGVPKPWYFCCSPRWCCPSSTPANDTNITPIESGGFIEADPPHLRAGVRIRGLRKEFPPASSGAKKLVAVDNLNMDLYEGQILSLLGHNGAGKTTTISMLTGLTGITSGDALINGMSLRSSLDVIRPSLGVCPQHDILFDLLTVTEHLEMYSAIKGIPSSEIPAAVTEMIKLVGLIEKTNTQSASLSGGQKRKLSVGIALLGDSKVVFLDEPTSGMDPYSRRWTWNLLKQKKKGRVIVLTTHFMDEADYLGDRIAIMAKGKVQCCGSSLFLKSKYGVGYTFTVSKTPSCDTKSLTNAVSSRVPQATVLSNAGTEISYQLPLDAADTFPSMFDHLDENLKPLGIDSYGISVTTLEEVFLRVGHAADGDHDDGKKEKKIGMAASKSKGGTTIDIVAKGDNENYMSSHSTPLPASFGRQVKALLIKRLRHTIRDRKSLMWQIGYPVLILLIGILLLRIAAAAVDPPSMQLSPSQYSNPMDVPVGYPSSVTDPTDTATFLNTLQTVETSIRPVSVLTSNLTSFAQYLVATGLTSGSGNNRYGAIYVNGPSLAGSVPLVDEYYTIFYNTTGVHSLPIYLNMLTNARLQHMRATLGLPTSPTPFVTAANHLLPPTANFKVLLDSSAALIVGIAFAFVPASIVGWIVKERQSKVKHLQIISGVSTLAYWVSTWLWDFISFMIPCALAMVIFAIYDLGSLIGSNSGATILAMILYSAAITPFTYCLSFLFDNHASAQNVMLLIYIVTGAVMGIVIYVLQMIESTQSIGKGLRYVLRFIPNYAFGEIIQNQMTRTTPLLWGSSRGLWDMDITGAPMLYLTMGVMVYFAILLLIEKVLASPDWVAKLFSTPTLSDQDIATEAKMSAEEDEDIIAERKRILDQAENKSGGAPDMISVQGMRKVYNGRFGAKAKCAVKNLYFGVPEGQCFGFLGINGAGKTTTLRMLSGDELPSKGTSYLNGLDIMSHQQEVRRLIGYCPQFDALIETLTSREHLTLFARIKGVSEAEIPRLVTELLDKLTLTEYADRPCGGYSGGNKRKLCVGLSLIGHPPIVFLDEPSTGMDPGSRRFMWSLISSTMRGRSVILTTHSMEECEALCQRIGIMVSGRLKCIGSANHLRQRYGHGYQLDVNVPIDRVNQMKLFVQTQFAGSQIIEHHDSNIKFRIRKGDRSLGAIFRILNDNRTQLGISEYSVSEATLEQIFIRFARQQEEETAQAEGMTDTTLLQLDDDLPAGERTAILNNSVVPFTPAAMTSSGANRSGYGSADSHHHIVIASNANGQPVATSVAVGTGSTSPSAGRYRAVLNPANDPNSIPNGVYDSKDLAAESVSEGASRHG